MFPKLIKTVCKLLIEIHMCFLHQIIRVNGTYIKAILSSEDIDAVF